MKDFDFDEIDKAVAGALSTEAEEPTTRVEETITTPVVERSFTPEAPTPVATPAPAPAPAIRRSSGRFMDVVHPSSDMRSKQTFTPPVPRQPIQPVQAAPAVDRVEETAPEIAFEDELPAWSVPLESPFLPDAKVEKRPLGGAAPLNAPLEDLLLDEPDEPRLEAPDEPRLEAHVMPDPLDFAAYAPVPAFEQEDTGSEVVVDEVAVEETVVPEVHAQPEEAPVDVSEVPLESVAVSEQESVAPLQLEVSPEPTPAVEPTAATTGPTSITQQYTEQPSSAEAPSTMYDTEAYNQPVTPVAKKKSGIWVVLWIFLLVILGGGAGVAFYLFVLPLL